MNNRTPHFLAILLVAFAIGVAVACKEKAGPKPSAIQAPPHLPAATNAIAALNQKDYEGAVAALVKIREAVSTGDQQMEFLGLTREVRGHLLDASATDPKAAQALEALRLMTSGR